MGAIAIVGVLIQITASVHGYRCESAPSALISQ